MALESNDASIEALDIHVVGIVQGVGFRPFVYRLAKKYLLAGWVLNSSAGVEIHVEGQGHLIDAFVMDIADRAPAAARVSEIEMHEAPVEGFDSFEIRLSADDPSARSTLVSPDIALCEECMRELFNPNDRRYRYPFINCTNCGPRFTITASLPYDRPSTSMASFAMCDRCASEYADPADRRFHAQPDACFECGPHISLSLLEGGEFEEDRRFAQEVRWGATREQSDALFAQAVGILRAGGIVAVKGLGGFHLVCDADNEQAISELRRRKHRFGKPLAVMMRSVDAVREVCEVCEEEAAVLAGSQKPIVLLRKRSDAKLACGLADGLGELGVMLPYTPVQAILVHDFVEAGGRMLVMTSGNVHDEPIVIDDAAARETLCSIADALLGNDRPILARYDDSVVRVLDAGAGQSAIQVVRRARGLSPVPVALPSAFRESGDAGQKPLDDSSCTSESQVEGGCGCERRKQPMLLAAGSEQKNTFCLAREGEAFVSQHIGDMENAETDAAWHEALRRHEELFKIEPTYLACDKHPEYLPSKWARSQNLPLVEVQHHHAHIASVIGEHDIAGAVCGIAFDGTGYGEDGAIWGGEVLIANASAFERFANFTYVPMPGGAAAVRHPLRMAYGVLWAYDLLDHPYALTALRSIADAADTLDQMIERGINTPFTSSVGRLFDAASALLGICTEPTYEGEPAIMLEAALHQGASLPDPDDSAADRYAIGFVKNVATETSTAQDTSVILLDAASTFTALLDDAAAGVDHALIARRFHDAFVRAIVEVAEFVRGLYGIGTVALSGGVFMNRYLIEHTLAAAAKRGFTIAVNRDLPPNDGCVSFGQAVVAWAALQDKEA